MSALKPCPFCGQIIGSGLSERTWDYMPDEVCCPAHTEWMTHAEWNRRAIDYAWVDGLFHFIKHGDEEHQAWLKNAMSLYVEKTRA